jgi:hypothetical protein
LARAAASWSYIWNRLRTVAGHFDQDVPPDLKLVALVAVRRAPSVLGLADRLAGQICADAGADMSRLGSQ